ncbi:integrin alpha [Leisingera sp. ANG59]|uniref:beta strand repeat-containing protein n=1 Tax=Leisingera sp. ANG59 TaxID=2675221 RepID=UPI001572337E|nr:integrin alpha [Leisingera sp. ANG59]NSY41547.1 hypothetical protein [Leisingera sp. ANG59]
MARSITFLIAGDVDTEITITELDDGTLRFDLTALDTGLTGDLRALFFDLTGVDVSGLSTSGVDVTDTAYEEGSVDTLGGDANIKGSVSNSLGDFDVGIEFGTSGMSSDDINSTSFILAHNSVNLTLDMIDLSDFGIRYTSVGEEDGSRTGSAKIGDQANGVADNDILTVNENEMASVDILANDTNGGTSVVTGAVDDGGGQFTSTATGFERTIIVNGLELGVMTISSAGIASFDANGADVDSLAEGEQIGFSVTYTTTAADGSLASADVSVAVTGADDTPESFGVVVAGQDAGDSGVGQAVNFSGDVNGDGIGDFLIGAPGGDPFGASNSGEVYVIFGNNELGTVIDPGTLDGTNGFIVNGIVGGGNAGFFVSGAGDVNGDGIDDIMIGAELGGASYVIFGKDTAATGGFNASFDLSILDGNNGFTMTGGSRPTRVSNAGDVNGDGIGDMLVGDWTASRGYVVFGRDTDTEGDFATSIDLHSLDGTDGFIFQGTGASGAVVEGAGDINGDGIDDILVNAPLATTSGGSNSGEIFVVYGKDTAIEGDFAANLNYTNLNGSNGFAIPGLASGDRLALAGSAGDVNGDGIDDLVLGAFQSDVNGTDSGQVYIVFGQDTATSGDFPANFDLSTLDGTNGFTMDGIDANDWAGLRVSAAGDQNGDGIDDFVFAATQAESSAGEVYIVFGRDTAADGDFAANFDLSTLDGTNGFILHGIDSVDLAGRALDATGDVNGDGINDFLIHAPNADPNGATNAGETYVVFGGSTNLQAFDASDGTSDGSIELELISGDTFMF